MQKKVILRLTGIFLCCAGLLSSCQKDLDAVLPQAGHVNYFSASDFLAAQSQIGSLPGGLDFPIRTDAKELEDIGRYPFFRYIKGAGLDQYPVPSAPSAMKETAVFYTQLPVGRHRFTFYCDTVPFVSKQLQAELKQDSYTLFYLADSLREDGVADYHAQYITEQREVANPGKLSLRLVHLSPDAGQLTLRAKKTDGSYTQDLAQVKYPDITPYAAIDTTGLTGANGQLSLGLFDPTGTMLTSFSLAGGANASYHVVIRGFYKPHDIRLPYYRTSSGDMMYQTYSLNANLRTSTRRIY